MKVVLTKDVAKVGRIYEVKDLADGYARNFIIARNLGLPATPENLKRVAGEREQHEFKNKISAELLAKNLAQLENTVIKIKAKANEAGHLFAGIHQAEISAAIKKQTGLIVPVDFIILPEPIKRVGEFSLGKIKLLVER